MNHLSQLKLLTLMFVVGTILLTLGSLLFIEQASHRWALLGLYTWSASFFIIYKTTQLLKKTKQNGTIKEQ